LEITQRVFFFEYEMKIANERVTMEKNLQELINKPKSNQEISEIISNYEIKPVPNGIIFQQTLDTISDKRPTLEEDRKMIAEEYKRIKEIEGKKRKFEYENILKKSTSSNVEKKQKLTDPSSILKDLDEIFDHSTVIIDSKNSIQVKINPDPLNFLKKKETKQQAPPVKEKKRGLKNPYILERDIPYKDYENVKLEKPRIPLNMHYHIPRDLRQKALEMIFEKYSTVFEDKKKSAIYALETELKINGCHPTQHGYWSKVKEVVKGIELQDE
jgi:hypothetical protein